MNTKMLCNQLLLLSMLCFSYTITYAQAPLIKQWDKTFGGSGYDDLTSLQQTSDGGYISGGSSYSNVSGNKTATAKGGEDYWVVKMDANGNKQWDKSYGGSSSDELFSLQQTKDGGYILGGTSGSGISGDKTSALKGGGDFWIVKIDANGNKQWDKSLGGGNFDQLYSLQQTSDGGYILGGYSTSNSSGDKSENSRGGEDYWIVKVDADGNKQWDKTFGGSGDDELYSLKQTKDGEYIIGGYSVSNSGGDKSENGRGNTDYWVIKVDANGNKQWDKTLGGSNTDNFGSLLQTSDGDFILGGTSFSGISGDKTEGGAGISCWVVKLDANGNKLWDKTTGAGIMFSSLQQTLDGGYILGGILYSNSADFWMGKINAAGNTQWNKTFGGFGEDGLNSLQQTKDGGYILGGYSTSNSGGDKSEDNFGDIDYWVIKLPAYTCEHCIIPGVSINNVSITEGNSGQTQLKFTVSLSDTAYQRATVCYGTRNGSATTPEDYAATSGTLTFEPGILSQTVTVLINGDAQCEGDENFTVELTDAVNATIKVGVGTGTILNDDVNCNTATSAVANTNAFGRAIVMAPNPVSSTANLRLNGFSGNTTVQLLTLQGKVLKTFKVQGGTTSKQFSVAELPNGTYYVAVSDAHGHQQSVQVIVAH